MADISKFDDIFHDAKGIALDFAGWLVNPWTFIPIMCCLGVIVAAYNIVEWIVSKVKSAWEHFLSEGY